jgi:hypothetical protein
MCPLTSDRRGLGLCPLGLGLSFVRIEGREECVR